MFISENHPTNTSNTQRRSKIHIEEMLKDIANSDAKRNIISLRYFNSVGAHESGFIFETLNRLPKNLMSYIAQIKSDKFRRLNIYRNDCFIVDATRVKDYIHVIDLSDNHRTSLIPVNKDNIIRYRIGKKGADDILKYWPLAQKKLISLNQKARSLSVLTFEAGRKKFRDAFF